jgi:hypothetical protein
MIWAYAICDLPDLPLPRRRGLAHAPLEAVRAGDLVAVVSRHTQPPGEPAVDALWAHERVVERLMVNRTVLPLRFGTKLPDVEAMRSVLVARADEFLAGLARVRGRVEIGVRAISKGSPNGRMEEMPAVPASPPASGREYLFEKLTRGRRHEREAAALHEPLAALAVASRRSALQSDDEVLRAAYLVERATVARFRATVERLQQGLPETAVLCTGPWPPYSFVGDGGDAVAKEVTA